MNREKVMTFMKKSLRFLPDKAYIKLYYRLRVGRKLNMNDPETLNKRKNRRRIFDSFTWKLGRV